MRYAIISDIHGNFPALQAVLEDAKAFAIDRFIFVGDYSLCYPFPNQVVDTIRSLPNAIVVSGNEEGYYRKLSTQDQSTWTDGQFASLYWAYRTLTECNHKYLAALPESIVVDAEQGNEHSVNQQSTGCVQIFHDLRSFFGSDELRALNSTRFAAISKAEGFSRDTFLRHIREVFEDSQLLQDINSVPKPQPECSSIAFVFGHSHLQWHAYVGDKLFVNPGSCGVPLDMDCRSPYTILEYSGGSFKVTERRVEYDINRLARETRASDLYSSSKVFSQVILRELFTPREMVQSFLNFSESYAQSINDPVRPFSHKTWEEAYELWASLQDGESLDNLR